MKNQRLLDLIIERYKLRPNLVSVLRVLADGQKYSYVDLSSAANVPKTKVYEIVNELQQMGLIDILHPKKGPTIYYMQDARKNILNFLNQDLASSMQKYEETVEILEEEERIEENAVIQTANQYVFGAVRIMAESDNICVLSRYKNVPAIFYPRDLEDYYKIRYAIAKSRHTLTGAKELTRIMFEETLNAIEKKKAFTNIVTWRGLHFFLERYRECFGVKKTAEYIKNLPSYVEKNNHKIFVLDETNPLGMFISQKRMVFAIMESQGEISGIYTNKTETVQTYLKLYHEMLRRCKPLEYYLERFIL